MNIIKKTPQKYNPIEEKRRTARINSLQKETEELREQLEKSRDLNDAVHRESKAWKAFADYHKKECEKLEEENQQLKLKLIQANIRMERAKSYLSGNILKEPEEAEQNTAKTQHSSDTIDAHLERVKEEAGDKQEEGK